eukprot:TRINITY_DN4616_c0_g1_i3.p1 TRINITY_DN4616_c0_g1~~TRINITY_DN4616_c0_g1_i3.p1  ORF type:complete len:693 (+),score=137.55 TRINITY_DN4616_c0_g1_i3:126-2204(+)
MVVAQVTNIRNVSKRTFYVQAGDILYHHVLVNGQEVNNGLVEAKPGCELQVDGLAIPWASLTRAGLVVREADGNVELRCVVGPKPAEEDSKDDAAAAAAADDDFLRLHTAEWEPVMPELWRRIGSRHRLGAVGHARDFCMLISEQEGSPEAAAAGKRETLGKALKGIMQNMIILATVAGYVYQLLFGKEGIIVATVVEDSTTGKMVLPHPLEDIIATWTAPFTMMFLFLNGTLLTSARIRFWPTLLAVMKVVLCAYFAYAFASWFGAGDMADFSFFYGTIPTGGAPLMFAAKFDSPTMPIVASASLFCLLLAAPIEMTTALFLGPGADTIIDHGLLSSTCKNMAIASLICGALVLLLLLLSSGDRALAEAMSSLRRPRPKNHRSMLVYTVAILSYSALTVALHKDELCDNGMFQNLFGFLQNIVNLMTMFMFYSTNIAQPSTTAAYTGVAITIIFISGVVALLMPYFNTWYDLCGTHTPFRAFRLAAFWNMACLAVIVSIAIWGVVKRQRSHRRSQEGRSQEITNLSLSELFEAPLSARQGSRQRSSEPRAKKNRRCGAVLTVTVMYTIRLLMMITMALQRSSGERETESGFTPMFLFTIMMEHGQGVVLLLTVLFQEEYREHFARACRQLEAAGFAPQVPAEVLGDAHSFIAAAAATAAIADANEECSPSGEDSRRQSLDSSELFRGIGAA